MSFFMRSFASLVENQEAELFLVLPRPSALLA